MNKKTEKYSRYVQHIREGLECLANEQDKRNNGVKYPETTAELKSQGEIFREIGNLLLKSENRAFEIDENNRQIIALLIAYLNGWNDTFNRQTKALTGSNGDIYAPIFLMGERGVGKTLLMQIASRFADIMRLKRTFINTSASELQNYMRVNGNLDFYTYNAGRIALKENSLANRGKPHGVCLHDLGIEVDPTSKGKIYGTDTGAVVNDFLMARYELYQNHGLMYHITTNLSIHEFANQYPPRVVDRFKQFNHIALNGASRRGVK
ncbi:MAG: hypothetical protein Q4G11_06200 [Gallicola sp.]|nr:hypothetical protein [Gallicola sp.]